MLHKPKETRPGVTCDQCGRVGTNGFTLIDRFADGSTEWRCVGRRSCEERQRRALRKAAGSAAFDFATHRTFALDAEE